MQDFVTSSLGRKQLAGNIAICNIKEVCQPTAQLPEKDIFVRERIVSRNTPTGTEFKKVVIFAWTAF